MPSGFSRFRVLNESGQNVNPVSFTANADEWGDPATQVLEREHGNNIGNDSIFSFPIPGQPQGIPGIHSVVVKTLTRAGPDVTITDWALLPSWEGYAIREVELSVAPDHVRARIFFSDDYFEERVRYF